MSEHEERVSFLNWGLMSRLASLTIKVSLLWGTVTFILQDKPVVGLICFLGFLALLAVSVAASMSAQLKLISVMVEAGVKRVLIGDVVGRPNPGQIDRMLRCTCDECQEIRDRFGLPDRVSLDSLLTADEEDEERELMEN